MNNKDLFLEAIKGKRYLASGVAIGSTLASASAAQPRHGMALLAGMACGCFGIGVITQLWADKLAFDRIMLLEISRRERRELIEMAWRERE